MVDGIAPDNTVEVVSLFEYFDALFEKLFVFDFLE
jgi:hypothetical protein